MSSRTRGCRTCQARKVLCDRGTPQCQRCIQSHRPCMGYGFRLSWPGKNTRRSLSASPYALPPSTDQSTLNRAWINTFSNDIQIHYKRRSLYGAEEVAGLLSVSPLTCHVPTISRAQRIPYRLRQGADNLLTYFEDVAFRALRVFGQDALEVRGLVLKMALSYYSPSADAILQAILALSALHRDGPSPCSQVPEQARQLKEAALRALAASAIPNLSSDDVARHVVCGMLLCAYEIQNITDISDYWLWFICGAKSLIKQRKLDASRRDRDLNLLVGWVQYYEVMARFSLRHWKRAGTAEYIFADKLGYHDKMPPVCTTPSIIVDIAEPPNMLLDLLKQVINLPTEDIYREPGYKKLALELENELNSSDTARKASPDTTERRVVEIFRLSIQVYLSRFTATDTSSDAYNSDRIDTVFTMLSQLDSFPYPFPLFVMGLEAHSDERRRIIVHLMTNKQSRELASNTKFGEGIMRSVWVQDDLDAGRLPVDFGYTDRIDGYISSQPALPVFI